MSTPEIITPQNAVALAMTIRKQWHLAVDRVTATTLTARMLSRSPRFNGRVIRFKFDGTGFKRQGEYLTVDITTTK